VNREIESIQKNDAEAPIKLPFLDAPVTLSDFSNLSAVLNITLLLWVLLLISEYRTAVAEYLRTGGEQEIVREVINLARTRRKFVWAVMLGTAVYLSLPSLLGTGLLISGRRTAPSANSSMNAFLLVITVLICCFAFSVVWRARKTGILSSE
jgi:hypothetical protein